MEPGTDMPVGGHLSRLVVLTISCLVRVNQNLVLSSFFAMLHACGYTGACTQLAVFAD